jgi:hypothetical protein
MFGSGSGMRNWSDPDPGSGIKHPGSPTLVVCVETIYWTVPVQYDFYVIQVNTVPGRSSTVWMDPSPPSYYMIVARISAISCCGDSLHSEELS